jgi:hypothetical protein
VKNANAKIKIRAAMIPAAHFLCLDILTPSAVVLRA